MWVTLTNKSTDAEEQLNSGEMRQYKYIRRYTILYMWRSILEPFSDSPSQQRVVKFLLENGFGISDAGRVVVNGIEVSATAIARVVGVDRRVVDTTVKRILGMNEIKMTFAHLRVTPDLTNVAKNLGLSVITILPKNAEDKNIVASAVAVLAAHDLPLRQIFVTDPYIAESPRLVIIIDGLLPATAIEELRALPAVESIIL